MRKNIRKMYTYVAKNLITVAIYNHYNHYISRGRIAQRAEKSLVDQYCH